MGRSVICNYWVNVNLSNGFQGIHGAMKAKDVKKLIDSEQAYQDGKGSGVKVVNAELWAQTGTARRFMERDFAIMDLNGNITHHNIS